MKPTIVAKCVVTNADGKVLILRRSPDDVNRPGGADFPGGGVETGENPTATVIRELHEEAGIKVSPQDLSLIYGATDEANNKIAITFLLKNYFGGITLSHEHDAFWWKTPDEAVEILDGIGWQAGLKYATARGLI